MAMEMLQAVCGQRVVSSSVSELLTLLITVQTVALASFGGGPSFDPKYYVDLSLKYPLNVTTRAVAALPRTPGKAVAPSTLTPFLKQYFNEPGSDLVPYTPQDFKPIPPNFLPRVKNSVARKWALQVHALWLILARQVSPAVQRNPNQHTLLPLVRPVVVPGARFREVYYWDSYWVVKGLLVSGMVDTAKGIVENLLDLVEKFGFMPNGARTYYENRSQPPLLSMMVRAIFDVTHDHALLKRALPILMQEHKFWTTEPHQVTVQDREGSEHRLSRYWAHWNSPRPESSTIDSNVTKGMSKTRQEQVYHDIATTAESGWDFSSRWMEDQQNLTTLRTSLIIPVDLNAFLFQMEKNIEYFGKVVGDNATVKSFASLASARRKAIQHILWNEEMSQWFDVWLSSKKCKLSPVDNKTVVYEWEQKRLAFASNFVPLWVRILSPGERRLENVMIALKKSGLVQPAGIATSLRNTGQQWDFPNAWAPLQDMIIEGLEATDSQRGKKMARDLARRWLRSNFAAYETMGKMIEKYDARYCGKIGGGGEYNPQTGFGWTNGVVLSLLRKYGWPAHHHPLACPSP